MALDLEAAVGAIILELVVEAEIKAYLLFCTFIYVVLMSPVILVYMLVTCL